MKVNFFIVAFSFFHQLNIYAAERSPIYQITEKEIQDKSHQLSVEWQFHYGDFLTAEQMDSISQKQWVQVPHTWEGMIQNGEAINRKGIATYYLRIKLPPDVNDLAYDARIAGLNYRLFFNGKLMGEVGKVGEDEESSVPYYLNRIYKIPDYSREIEIIYHISNFHYRKGGLWRAPILGPYEVLTKEKSTHEIIAFFLMGAILFMGIYHLGMNLFKYKTSLNYFFGLVCIFTVLRTAAVSEYILSEYLSMPWQISARIEFLSFFLVLGFTVKFVYALFPSFIPKLFTEIVFYISIIASVFTLVAPMYYGSFLIPVMQLVTLLSGVILIFYLVKESFKGNKEVIIALVGFIMLFSVTIIEILIHYSRITADVVFSMGIFLYLFSHVVIMANRLSKHYEKTDRLSLELLKNNAQLEYKVKERTAQLDEQNKALQLTNQRLRSINEEKENLMHAVAHDLKAPINTTLGFIELIKLKANLKKEHQEYLDMIEKSNIAGLQFIGNLLEIDQVEKTTYVNAERLNCYPYFHEIYVKYKKLADKKSIQLHLDLKEISEQPFYTDLSMLGRVLDNLLTNAIKYSESGSNIHLQIIYNHQLEIKVSDQGLGIAKEDLPHIFKKFHKIANKPTAGEQSNGLGLSIAYQLVHKLNGNITAQSKKGEGSTFKVRLNSLPEKN